MDWDWLAPLLIIAGFIGLWIFVFPHLKGGG